MEYFTPEELAQQLKVNVGTVWRWIREGNLPALRIGKGYRISDEQLAKFLSSREVGQTEDPSDGGE